MGNTHLLPDTMAEMMARGQDLLPACITAITGLTVPASGLVFPALVVQGYVQHGEELVYVDQPAHALGVGSSAGQYWLAIHRDTSTPVSGWPRSPGTHYVINSGASQPANPDGVLTFASAIVTAGNITSVTLLPGVVNPMSKQMSNAVAITGGSIGASSVTAGAITSNGLLTASTGLGVGEAAQPLLALFNVDGIFRSKLGVGGIPPTYPLDVNGMAHFFGAVGMGATPMAGTTLTVGGSIDAGSINAAAITSNGLLTASTGLGVGEAAQASLALFNVDGIFRSKLGVGGIPPTYPLDVNGMSHFVGSMGLGATPMAGTALTVGGSITAGGPLTFTSPGTAGFYRIDVEWDRNTGRGMLFHGLANDLGYEAMVFTNVAGAVVGGITSNATSTLYGTTSDVRLKHDVHALAGELAVVKALRPVSFLWNADNSPGVGFLASEVAAQVEGVITGEPDAREPDGSIRPQMIDYSKLVPFLTGAIKDLAAQVEALTARLAVLEDSLGL